MTPRGATAYRKADLDSAPKHLVLERLFERFGRDVADAKIAIAVTKDIQKKAAMIDHALRIVIELIAALDHEAAPELCANLESIYHFVTDRLTEANHTLATSPLDEAARLMADIGAAFREVHAR